MSWIGGFEFVLDCPISLSLWLFFPFSPEFLLAGELRVEKFLFLELAPFSIFGLPPDDLDLTGLLLPRPWGMGCGAVGTSEEED